MKSSRFVVLLIILFATAPTIAVKAQSQNAQALNWLRNGLIEKDLSKKIAAYRKAIEFDSLLVEAMYNLGVAYRKQQNYPLAEQWLSKAYSAKPDKIKNDLKLQILFDLGRTYKGLGKLKESEEALKNSKGLANDRSTRAKISFELGRCLFDQGRHDEALAELRDGQSLNAEKNEIFQNFIELVEGAVESQRLYQAAEAAVASGNAKQAQILVEQIREKYPHQKNMEILAAKVDSAIKAETNLSILAAMYEQAQKEVAAGNLETAIVTYESLLKQDGAYKDASGQLEGVRRQLAEEKIQAQLEEDYTTGMSALREQNWRRAILFFENVVKTEENFRDARQRLDEAARELKNESAETIAARYYVDGVAALNRNDLGNALAALEKVRRLNSRYRNVNELLEEIEQQLQQQTKAPAAVAASSEQIDNLYQEAVAARGQKKWLQAVVALEKLHLLQPNYRDVVELLAEARAQLSGVEKNAGSGSGSLLTVGGAVVALILLPVIGLIAFAPAIRARLHLLRGNLMAAALIYEKILSRHPGRLKLYPILANIYLLIRRYDEPAMKVYQVILNLNIATQKRDEINAIVAQKYLTEGRMDSDAISVLEGALKAERQKQSHSNSRDNV